MDPRGLCSALPPASLPASSLLRPSLLSSLQKPASLPAKCFAVDYGNPRKGDLHRRILDSGDRAGHRSARMPPSGQLQLPRAT
ncbi:hypothetical protein KFK09_000712 [Dendrobium nobile]|uniref:Uncharacterized protein n=1 Tax=Dendrobium nobile TaxID=94219 RepID=A0A8T3CEN9_DENNO|nr:hypothetical protein KFK09_000712 [Dendrobium nobile]